MRKVSIVLEAVLAMAWMACVIIATLRGFAEMPEVGGACLGFAIALVVLVSINWTKVWPK